MNFGFKQACGKTRASSLVPTAFIVQFLLKTFVPNGLDVARIGRLKPDMALLRAEFMTNHRVTERYPVARLLPKGGVGAEIGVFTGLFSAVLLEVARPRKMYFVDPWWREFGPQYPDWGIYTGNGKLSTRAAHRIASERISKHARGAETEILVERSTDFLPRVPDAHFDWVYLDSTHSYQGTCDELQILRAKIKPGGLLMGDDWNEDPSHTHYGVSVAVKEAVTQGEFGSLRVLPAKQWAVRRRTD